MTKKHQCILCDHPGHIHYENLTDRMSDSPGTWNQVECNNINCGLIWLDPTPTTETLRLAYKNYYTHAPIENPNLIRRFYERCKIGYLVLHFKYPKQYSSCIERILGWILALFPARRAAFDASILWLPWVANGKVLEIGCSNGDRLHLLKNLGWKTIGIEPDPKSAHIATERGLEIINGFLEPGRLPESSFDAIILSHVIEHLPKPLEMLKEFHRLLKPGGNLIMLTPNTKSFGHQKFGRDWLHLDPPRHLHLFHCLNVSLALKKAGFEESTFLTTLRDANWTLGGSHSLKYHGHYKIGHLSLKEKLIGMAMLYREWIALKKDPFAGEDLLCVSQKSSPNIHL